MSLVYKENSVPPHLARVANRTRVVWRHTLETYKQLAHTTNLCNYQVWFYPKYNFPVPRRRIWEKARDRIPVICEWKRIEIVEGLISTDHVHLVLSIPH